VPLPYLPLPFKRGTQVQSIGRSERGPRVDATLDMIPASSLGLKEQGQGPKVP
jgi:hypothetical protein